MPFRRINGRFHVIGYQPDGDTVRFAPDDPNMLAGLSGPAARVNARGHVSLRLEGIDTLETHFEGLRQPAPFADGAVDRLLAFLGITNVVWAAERRSITSASDAVAGHIVSRATDKFGRVIAFAFPGAAADSNDFFLSPEGLEGSANLSLLREGLAFATFYSGLFSDLRQVMADAVRQARTGALALHPVDKTAPGAKVSGLSSLTDDHVFLPKLFRRAAVYVQETGTIRGFKAAMEASREPVLELPTMNFTHLDTFIEEQDLVIRLTQDPLNLVFDPMPQRIETDFKSLVSAALSPSSPMAEASVLAMADRAAGTRQDLPRIALSAEAAAFQRRVAFLRTHQS